jgi:pimeloyl-ACP methyl ester carboxylesterase
MHGFGASTFSWRDVLDPLSASGTVIAYDRPGFGFTERPTTWAGDNPYGFAGNFDIVDALIAEFGSAREIVLVGHSAGGQLAAEYVRLNPTKVQRLVLADPAILTTGGGPEWVTPLLSIPQIDALGPSLVAGIASSGDDLLRQSFYDQSQVTQAVYDGYHAPLQIRGWEKGFWEFTKAPRANDLAAHLSTLTLPTLLVTGSDDTVVPTSDTQKLATLLPDATLVIIPNTGHLPQEEDPRAFAAAINDWLALVR